MKYEWKGMLFDWDEEKNAVNLAKHGRSFLDSHLVWLQPHTASFLPETQKRKIAWYVAASLKARSGFVSIRCVATNTG